MFQDMLDISQQSSHKTYTQKHMEKLPKTATKEITIKELNYQMMLNIPPRPNKPMSTPIKSKKANSMKEKSVALRYPPSQMLQKG